MGEQNPDYPERRAAILVAVLVYFVLIFITLNYMSGPTIFCCELFLIILIHICLYIYIPICLYSNVVKVQWERAVLVFIFCLMSVPNFCCVGCIYLLVTHPSTIARGAFRQVIGNPSGTLEITQVIFNRPEKVIVRDKIELDMLKTTLHNAKNIGLNFDYMESLDLSQGPELIVKLSNGVVLEIRTETSRKYPSKVLISTLQFDDDSNYYLLDLPDEIAFRFRPL